MAYGYGRRRSRAGFYASRSRTTSRRRPATRRRTRRTRSRSGAQRIVIQVVGGPAGTATPMSIANLSSKGRRPLLSKY